MMTAKINFITNNLLVDMTCRENELRSSLQNIGILIVPNMIYLDNRRTLQIQLNANDEVGEIVKTLIDTERDTLGTVQRLCRSVYCLNEKHRAELIEMIENYIEYYNNKRLQRNLGVLTPMEKHEIYLQAA